MRAAVALVALALALAGCTPAPRTTGEPFRLPEELAWRYVSSCLAEIGQIGPAQVEWGDGPALVTGANLSPDQQAAAHRVEDCLDKYRYEPHTTSFAFISAYERAQLFDWYTRETAPCLTALGVKAPEIPRAEFFVPGERPWNVYTDMDDVPFDTLIQLYQDCPPVPDYLLARHTR